MNNFEMHQELIAQSRRMRANPTPAEALLWSKLRKRKLGGYRFLRQRIIGPYIVDFYCAELNLIVEIDGPIHDFQKEYDEERTVYLENLGKKVIQFGNIEIQKNLEEILAKIEKHCHSDSQAK